MRVGILGSGLMGAKLGTIFARAGHEVVFSYSHDGRTLTRGTAGRRPPSSRGSGMSPRYVNRHECLRCHPRTPLDQGVPPA
jgi:hypothetical protein